MFFSRLTRRLACWLAAWAVLAAAVMPGLSHAWASARGPAGQASWVEVCTTQGAKWVLSAPSDGEESAPATAHALESCPYCSLHAPALGFPPPALLALPDAAGAEQLPRAFLAAPHTLHAWVSAQPRAPPFIS